MVMHVLIWFDLNLKSDLEYEASHYDGSTYWSPV